VFEEPRDGAEGVGFEFCFRSPDAPLSGEGGGVLSGDAGQGFVVLLNDEQGIRFIDGATRFDCDAEFS